MSLKSSDLREVVMSWLVDIKISAEFGRAR